MEESLASRATRLYKQAKEADSLSCASKASIFGDCRKYWGTFLRENQSSLSVDEIQRLRKNISFASAETAIAFLKGENFDTGMAWVNQYLDDALAAGLLQPSRYLAKLGAVFDAITSSTAPLSAKLKKLEETTEKCPSKTVWRGKFFCLRAELLLLAGVVELEERTDFAGAHRYFFDALPLLQSAWSCHESEVEVVRDMNDLDRRLRIQLAITSSRKHRKMGDSLFNKALLENESYDQELMYDAFDEYKAAVHAASKYDVESEAIALSRIGKTWFRIFKDSDKARPYCKQAIQLGMSLSPRDLSPTEWWQETQEILNQIQRESDKKAQAEKDAIEGPIMQELKPKLDQIRQAANTSVKALICLLRSQFCPEGVDVASFGRLPEDGDPDDVNKRHLKKAVVVYHPDKWVASPLATRVLHQEITKILNGVWSTFKGADSEN